MSSEPQSNPADIQYKHEFIFNDGFDDTIFNEYTDASDGLKVEIQKTANSLHSILTIKPGIRSISSFSYYLSDTFKVTVINTSWIPPSA